jgi:hypothetical protein
MDIFSYAAMINNKKEGSRIMNIVTEIVETDIIAPNTIKANNGRISELRDLGEILIVETLLHKYPYKF